MALITFAMNWILPIKVQIITLAEANPSAPFELSDQIGLQRASSRHTRDDQSKRPLYLLCKPQSLNPDPASTIGKSVQTLTPQPCLSRRKSLPNPHSDKPRRRGKQICIWLRRPLSRISLRAERDREGLTSRTMEIEWRWLARCRLDLLCELLRLWAR